MFASGQVWHCPTGGRGTSVTLTNQVGDQWGALAQHEGGVSYVRLSVAELRQSWRMTVCQHGWKLRRGSCGECDV